MRQVTNFGPPVKVNHSKKVVQKIKVAHEHGWITKRTALLREDNRHGWFQDKESVDPPAQMRSYFKNAREPRHGQKAAQVCRELFYS
jgi:hypothetical protein